MRSKVCLAQQDGHIFIILAAMTPRQVRIVQESFQLIAPRASEAARLFYDTVFHLAPEVRPLFPDDMAGQRTKFIQMLGMVINSLGNASEISEHMADLGRRHASYEVKEKHYALIGQALLSTLQKLLGAHFTTEIRSAWAAAYNMLTRLMLEAAATPYATGNFYGSIVRGVVASQYGAAVAMPDQNEQASDAAPSGESVLRKHLSRADI